MRYREKDSNPEKADPLIAFGDSPDLLPIEGSSPKAEEGSNIIKDAENHPGYYISDALLLDYPIMDISKGDVFNIGLNYMVVITSRSVWVVGPKSIEKILSYFQEGSSPRLKL